MRNLYLLTLILFISCGKQDQYNEAFSMDAALVSVMDEKEVDNQLPSPIVFQKNQLLHLHLNQHQAKSSRTEE
ncbi:hypothetical protein [Epilithonimonas lactis]|uniref:Uncharacterized protein n=1 Tax=Epilithonimonas lactis TaxID=421072 RepID=A0A085BHK5_9FLAO|nr:hypothetical protein [Epilithonimonas lactis]KFC21950.1 hypothetical protein IO89_08225 [Epilithonimonas lactis]